MSLLADFEAGLPPALRQTFGRLESPVAIQRYLDSLPYVAEDRDRCPLDVMRDGRCHCLDGGLFAALALRRIGDPGLIIDLVPQQDADGRNVDDDHVLAVFRRHGRWGALAKSNFPWLRYREPVYRSLRELAMSYFEVYVNAHGRKSLRGYTRPFDIARQDALGYALDEAGAAALFRKFYVRREIALISRESESLLQPVDQLAFDSAFVGVNWDWVYRPDK